VFALGALAKKSRVGLIKGAVVVSGGTPVVTEAGARDGVSIHSKKSQARLLPHVQNLLPLLADSFVTVRSAAGRLQRHLTAVDVELDPTCWDWLRRAGPGVGGDPGFGVGLDMSKICYWVLVCHCHAQFLTSHGSWVLFQTYPQVQKGVRRTGWEGGKLHLWQALI
jgi:hypothetical protein